MAASEDAIYWDESKGRRYGSVSLGFDSGGKRLRRKVSGKTMTAKPRKIGAGGTPANDTGR